MMTSVIIPDGVTHIGHGAFAYCKNLTGVILPDSISYIGAAAFNGCDSLTEINIPYAAEIESSAFPDSVKIKYK